MAQRYEKAKRSADFDGDHVASVIAHMLNLGATMIVIDATGLTIAITPNVKLPENQVAHLEIVDKGLVPDIAIDAEVKP